MAATTFESTLNAEGLLIVPQTAVEELGLHPGDAVHVRIESAPEQKAEAQAKPSALDRAVYKMTHRTPEQIAQAQVRAMEMYKPRRAVPPGKTLADMVSGKWPGDETDEQINAALKELS